MALLHIKAKHRWLSCVNSSFKMTLLDLIFVLCCTCGHDYIFGSVMVITFFTLCHRWYSFKAQCFSGVEFGFLWPLGHLTWSFHEWFKRSRRMNRALPRSNNHNFDKHKILHLHLYPPLANAWNLSTEFVIPCEMNKNVPSGLKNTETTSWVCTKT